MRTTGSSSRRARIALNFAMPHVHGFRWYPAIQSINTGLGMRASGPDMGTQVVILLQLGGFHLPRDRLDEVGRPPPRLAERAPHEFADDPARKELQSGEPHDQEQQKQHPAAHP